MVFGAKRRRTRVHCPPLNEDNASPRSLAAEMKLGDPHNVNVQTKKKLKSKMVRTRRKKDVI